jgi:ERCC4-type nuclease
MYETKLIIDNREGSIKSKFLENKEKEYNIIYKNLDYGDIIIDVNESNNETNESINNHLMVIERKTLSDLSASIKDGRYLNQKIKLLTLVPTNCLYYIIEGPIDFVIDNNIDITLNGISKKTMLSCIINTLVRDNIKVFITKDINETCDLICNIYDRVSNDPGKYLVKKDAEPQIIKAKKNNMTKEIYFEKLLCQIPDVSTKTAKAICKKFTNMAHLQESLNNLSHPDKLKVLKEIYIEDDNGKKRKISEKVLKNIIEFLF